MDLSWLWLRMSLSESGERDTILNKNTHSEHAQASCDCKAVSRSFPYSFHLSPRQSKIDMLSVRDLQKRTKERPSINHLKLQPSTHRPEPSTRALTHLPRLELGDRAKSEKVSIRLTLYDWLISHCRRVHVKGVH